MTNVEVMDIFQMERHVREDFSWTLNLVDTFCEDDVVEVTRLETGIQRWDDVHGTEQRLTLVARPGEKELRRFSRMGVYSCGSRVEAGQDPEWTCLKTWWVWTDRGAHCPMYGERLDTSCSQGRQRDRRWNRPWHTPRFKVPTGG